MDLKLQGFKAADRDLTLHKLTVICAPNGTGKSAVGDGLRFLLCSYVPAYGKTEAATAVLMSGSKISVEAVLPGGRVMQRSLERDGASFKGHAYASWATGTKLAEHEAAIMKLSGANAQNRDECLDIRELLSLTPNKRAARIEELIGVVSAESVIQRVARLTIARLLEIDEERLPEDHREAAGSLPAGRIQILRELSPAIAANLTENGIPSVINWINESKKEAEKKCQHRRQALRELESRVTNAGVSTISAQDLEENRAGLQKKIGAIQERDRAETNRMTRLDLAKAELTTTEPLYTKAIEDGLRLRASSAEIITSCEEKLEEYVEQLASLEARTITVNVDTQRLDLVKRELDGLVDEKPEDLKRYEKIVEDLEAELADAHANPWVQVKDIAEGLKDLEIATVDPFAGELKVLAHANMPSTDEIIVGLAAARENLEKRSAANVQVAERNLERAERRTVLAKERDELELRALGAKEAADKRATEKKNEIELLQRKQASAKAEIENQRQRVLVHEELVRKLRGDVLTAEATIASLSEAPAPDPTPVTEIETAIARIDEQLASIRNNAALLAEVDIIRKEVLALEARADVTKAIEYSLTRVREEEIQRRSGGLRGLLNEFLAGAGRKETPYLEPGRNVCDIGWIREDGRKVALQAMSGGEYAFFATALTAAVIIQRAAPFRLLLVEAGECDDILLAQLMGGIRAMANRLSYALVMTPHAPQQMDSWSVLQLREPAMERAA